MLSRAWLIAYRISIVISRLLDLDFSRIRVKDLYISRIRRLGSFPLLRHVSLAVLVIGQTFSIGLASEDWDGRSNTLIPDSFFSTASWKHDFDLMYQRLVSFVECFNIVHFHWMFDSSVEQLDFARFDRIWKCLVNREARTRLLECSEWPAYNFFLKVILLWLAVLRFFKDSNDFCKMNMNKSWCYESCPAPCILISLTQFLYFLGSSSVEHTHESHCRVAFPLRHERTLSFVMRTECNCPGVCFNFSAIPEITAAIAPTN